jgi:hypothetical protein
MKEESVVIHIGYHKAASTYLQWRIFPKLPLNCVFLAEHKPQVLDFAASGKAFERELLQWVQEEITRKYTPPHELTLVSLEDLTGHAYGRKTNDPFIIADTLKRAFPGAKILVVIRNQFEYMLSVYAYRVAIKGMEYRELAKFLREEGRLGLFEKLEYDRLIAYYISLFGKDNVLVLPVELLKADPDRFFEKLAGLLQVTQIPFKRNKKVNPSTRVAWVIQLWRPINFLFACLIKSLQLLHIETHDYYANLRLPFYRFREKITQRLNSRFKHSQKLAIPPDFARGELLARYAESNLRLEQLTNLDLKGLGYPYKPTGQN